MIRAIEPVAGLGAMVTDATHLFAGFALAGPEVPAVLERITSWDPATLAPGEATGAPIVEVRALLVRRDLSVPVWRSTSRRSTRDTSRSRSRWWSPELGGAPVGWQALRAEGWS